MSELCSIPLSDSAPAASAGGRTRRRTKILCFVPRLANGGAEMHLLRLLNHFDTEEFALSLAVVRGGGSYEARLRSDVNAIPCGWQRLPSATLRLQTALPRLRRMLQREKPDVVIAFLDQAVAVMARAIAGLPGPRPLLIAGIQNNLSMTLAHLPRWTRGWLSRSIEAGYARADLIVALSSGVAHSLVELVPAARDRITVIHNAGYDPDTETLSLQAPSLPTPAGNWFLGCGRLTRQKDFSTLLKAFARIKDDTEGELWILGRGDLRTELERESAALKLGGRVEMPGFVPNPFSFMARASTFVLSSRWEGFGNVLTEAMACGTPVISTDCPYGPREILEDGKWGELVPVGDVEALAAAMRSSVHEGTRFRARAEKARTQVTRFAAPSIAREYEQAIRQLLGNRTRKIAA